MRRCDGVSRREMLRVGGLLGLGLWTADWLRLRAAASASTQARAKSCILLWLDGGPSHLETFDLKPDAPSEVRGPFRPMATNVPGIQICELLPHTAQLTDKLAIIRSMTSPLGEHGLANHYLLTGFQPTPALEYPSYGAVVAHERGGKPTLPPYVAVPEYKSTAGAGYLGQSWEPFATGGDPAKPDFRVRDLDFYPEVNVQRMDRRRRYLGQLEQFQRQFAESAQGYDSEFEQAYRLVTSPEAKQAFDLDQETPQVRARYGPRTFGQSCLLARRLVERGVPFVSVQNAGWDTHEGLVVQLKEGYAGAQIGVGLIPTFDQAFAALVADLNERGLLSGTLVIAMGEFGRTPKLNAAGGRDHWPRVFSVVLAGAGIAGGQVIGASDRHGESPADRPVTPADLARTIYTLLGVDPDRELHTSDGRPVRINQGGEVIRELVT
jgi:hypothetical protein